MRFFVAALGLGLSLCSLSHANPSLVIDASSGRVLHEEEAGRPWLPASLTKMMTAYVTLKAVKAGRLSMQSGLVISQKATRQAPAKMGFRTGTVVTVDNALKIIMVKSANDVSVAIAEGVGGSVENFVAMMNVAAARLGMTGSHFVNPHGLPGGQQSTTARDMAILARALLAEFPEHDDLWSISAIQYNNKVIRNTNHLIGRYPGADGFKTGFVCASGFNVVATATRGGRRLIAVVLGAQTARGRAEHAARLFEASFAAWGGARYGIDQLPNAGGAVANIRDQICRRRGKELVMPPNDEMFEAERAGQDLAYQGAGGQSPSYLTSYMPTSGPVEIFTTAVAPAAAKPARPAAVKTATTPKPAPSPARTKAESRRKEAPAPRPTAAPQPEPQVPTEAIVQPQEPQSQRPMGSLMNLPPRQNVNRAPGSLMPQAAPVAAPLSLQGATGASEPAGEAATSAAKPRLKPKQPAAN